MRKLLPSASLAGLVMLNILLALTPKAEAAQDPPEAVYGLCRSPHPVEGEGCWCDWTFAYDCNASSDCYWEYPATCG